MNAGTRLRKSSDLRHFVKRLPFRSLRYILFVDPPAGFLFIRFEPLVQIQRIGAANRRLRHHQHDLVSLGTVVAQDYIAVQIEAFRDRGPLETDKSRESPWLIVKFGRPENSEALTIGLHAQLHNSGGSCRYPGQYIYLWCCWYVCSAQ
jgi:hypothetical protein